MTSVDNERKSPFRRKDRKIASRNQQRRHGEDGDYSREYDELVGMDATDLEREKARLVELRNGVGMTAADNNRLRACIAAIRAQQIRNHWMG